MPGNLRVGALDALDDQGARCAARDFHGTEAVDVRVIPIKPRRFVIRNTEAIFKRRIPRLDQGLQHLVLTTHRRHRHSMKVQVGRERGHRSAVARPPVGTAPDSRHRTVACGRLRTHVSQGIGETQYQLVAGMQAKRGGLGPIRQRVTVSYRAICFAVIVNREIHVE
jgi:hypothetical protein